MCALFKYLFTGLFIPYQLLSERKEIFISNGVGNQTLVKSCIKQLCSYFVTWNLNVFDKRRQSVKKSLIKYVIDENNNSAKQ